MIRRHFLPHCYTSNDALQSHGAGGNAVLGPVIRCLVWNILKAKRLTWAADFQQLVANQDLVLLQEAVFKTRSDPLFTDSHRLRWVMARSFRHPITQVEHGIKTGCIATSLEQHFYLSPHAEPLTRTQKLLLTTLYPLNGEDERLLVLNMHAINFVSVKKYVDQLGQLSAALQSHKGPIILAGDFNTWNVTRLSEFQRVAAEAGLIEAPMHRQRKLVHMNQHLDHVFYRGLTLHHVESLARYQSSDHAPIVATFERARPPATQLSSDQNARKG